MSWLEELKEFVEYYDNCDDHSLTFGMETIDKHTLRRLIAIVEEAEWGSILCDDIPDPQCPICSGSKESGHGLVYETKRPCPYSDEWVKQ